MKIATAVVGYGYWGPNLARNIANCQHTQLAAICDPDPSAQARAARTHPHTDIVGDWRDVVDDPAYRAIVIATPVATHHRLALEALEAGKHVLVEKPLAQTVRECDELIQAAGDRVLMVGHTFQYNPAVEHVAHLIQTGQLGDPYYVAMRRANLGIVRQDHNVVWSLAPHDISILSHWLGGCIPLSVSATGQARLQEGIEDVAFLTLQYSGGVIAHIHVSWLDPNKIREATIVGSEQMAVYDDTSPNMKIRVYDKGIDKQLGRYDTFGKFQMLARSGDIHIPKVAAQEPLANEVQHFADSIINHRQPLTDGVSGRQVVAVLEAAQRSLQNQGQAEPVIRSLPLAA